MEFRVPELGEGVYEAEFIAWLVELGEAVKRGQVLMEVMTDKATMEVPAPFAGTLTALNAEPGQKIKVGDVVLSYTLAGQEPEVSVGDGHTTIANGVEKPAEAGQPHHLALAPESVKAAPSVRRMARKLGIDLTAVHGSGPQGRVLVGDLTPQIPVATGALKQPAEPRSDYGTPGTRIKLQGLRRRIADHMALAKRIIPHYSYIDECDLTELVRLRDAFKEPYATRGVRLTYLAFFVKAVAGALREVPLVNASLDEAGGAIVLHDRYHIGIAVATPAGLIVPVVHDADRKDLAEIARAIERLGNDARGGKSKRDDLHGGTFTVTSVGNIGGLISTPIINHPEVGILGLGKVVKRPVYDTAGQLRPAEMIYLSFSFDHRVVDGAVGAAFGNAVIRRLRQPAELLL